MSEYILEMKEICKEFPGVRVLDHVNFKLRKGEVHALCGENGAGKSTLIKILSGIYPEGTYSGEVLLNATKQTFRGIKDSEHAGIATIYQELTLVKYMTVGENIFLGNEPLKGFQIDWNEVYAQTGLALKKLGLNINPHSKIMNLGIGQQQLVEIAKAMTKKAKIFVFDEPTAALTESESEHLLNIIRQLKNEGITSIYISHKLNEVLEIADSITILRDGKSIASVRKEELTEDRVISLMVGRELNERFPKIQHTLGETILKVENFTLYDKDIPNKKRVNNVSFQACKGEILGIAGLMGAGRTELAQGIFGVYQGKKEGKVFLKGEELAVKNPRDAISRGVVYLTEDRKRYGLVLIQDIKENIALANLDKISSLGIIDQSKKIKESRNYAKELKIKAHSLEQMVGKLSGGNQQKVVLAKWLMSDPKVLILDEPTRGIDVGAKYDIYNIMNQLVEQGICIIMISSELPEILGMCDRILVLSEGKLTGELSAKEATQEKIMQYATGGK